jgi:AcrR family transcriptional regulator
MDKKDTLTRLKAEERKLRQQIIIDAAREVFGKKTYDKASMAEIADTAGIAKSSIYTYFKSQEELYAKIAYMDSRAFIENLQFRIAEKQIGESQEDSIKICINFFLDYYIAHKAQWRMITHFALHGNKDMGALDQLNEVGRKLMDLFESIFKGQGCQKDSRILAHTLFSCLSGILIAFRNYPGRTEAARIVHMKRIGSMVEAMFYALVHKA